MNEVHPRRLVIPKTSGRCERSRREENGVQSDVLQVGHRDGVSLPKGLRTLAPTSGDAGLLVSDADFFKFVSSCLCDVPSQKKRGGKWGVLGGLRPPKTPHTPFY